MKFNTSGSQLPSKKDIEIINGDNEKFYCYKCEKMFYEKSKPCFHLYLRKNQPVKIKKDD